MGSNYKIAHLFSFSKIQPRAERRAVGTTILYLFVYGCEK